MSTANLSSDDPQERNEPDRRRRFEAHAASSHPLTPLKLEALRHVAENRFLSTRQVAAVLGISEVAARRHLRDLLDLGLCRRMPVPGASVGRKALLDDNLHLATREGVRELRRLELLPPGSSPGEPARSSLLAHDLAVRDVLAWLARSAHANRAAGHAVERWSCVGMPKVFGTVPDAALHYRFRAGEDGAVIPALLEVDMGSERAVGGGPSDRWASKLASYAAAFAEEGAASLIGIVGAPVARVVVVVPDAARAAWVAGRATTEAAGALGAYVWIAAASDFGGADVTAPIWLRPDGSRRPFVPTAPRVGGERDGDAGKPCG